MLTHHLTLIQLKRLFYRRDLSLVVVNSGLAPEDAENYELKPIVALSLSVEKLSIWHQKLYIVGEAIDLGSFLYQAWFSETRLGGIPNKLRVDSDLLLDYKLLDSLKEMCGSVIPEVLTEKSNSFSASKKYAQEIALNAVRGMDESKTLPSSIRDLFTGLNGQLRNWAEFNYRIQLQTRVNTAQRHQALVEHSKKVLRYPFREPTLDWFYPCAWFSNSAYSVKPMAKDQCLLIQHETGNVLYLAIGYDTNGTGKSDEQQEDDEWLTRSAGYLWADEEPGFKATIDSLGFPVKDLIDGVVEKSELQGFFSGRKALPLSTAQELRAKLRNIGLILYPKSHKSIERSFDFLTLTDVRWSAEIRRYQSEFAGRVYVVKSHHPQLIVYVVTPDSKIDPERVPKLLSSFSGEIDFGHAGYAAITFWLENYIEGQPRVLTSILIKTIEEMLSSLPEWRDRW